METALRDEGIEPDVISNDDSLIGAMPYVHSPCTVVKLHGDYLDTRIKNTPEELAQYSVEMNKMLDRILDEFGLIICGWSGIWDTALKAAIMRCPNRRFSTYWLARQGNVDEQARDVLQHRRAEVVAISSADSFFRDLDEKITALESSLRPHPLSTVTAVATVKRYLPDPLHRIRLHDLVVEETERVVQLFKGQQFGLRAPESNDEFMARLKLYEEGGERLWAMLAAIAYYGDGPNHILLTRAIERLMRQDRYNGFTFWLEMLDYPPLVIMYIAGISAVSVQRFDNLAAVLYAPKFRDTTQDRTFPAIKEVNAKFGMYRIDQAFNEVKSLPNNYPSISDHLFDVVRPIVRDYLPNDAEYEAAFDLFEFLLNLTYMDLVDQKHSPYGQYKWKYFNWAGRNWESSPVTLFLQEEIKRESNSLLVQAGFFGGSAERMRDILDAQLEFLKNLNLH